MRLSRVLKLALLLSVYVNRGILFSERDSTMKIYVLGDSISIHYGPYLKDCLAGIMDYSRKDGEDEALLNLDEPQGANGGDSRRVLSFLRGKAGTGGIDADYLLLNCGLHDLRTDPVTEKHQVPVEEYCANLRLILETVRNMRPELIWIRTTLCKEQLHNLPGMKFYRYAADCVKYNAEADAIMTAAGIPMIDLFSFTANLGDDLYCDHVHFNDDVRRQQAAFIAGWLMGRLSGVNR